MSAWCIDRSEKWKSLIGLFEKSTVELLQVSETVTVE